VLGEPGCPAAGCTSVSFIFLDFLLQVMGKSPAELSHTVTGTPCTAAAVPAPGTCSQARGTLRCPPKRWTVCPGAARVAGRGKSPAASHPAPCRGAAQPGTHVSGDRLRFATQADTFTPGLQRPHMEWINPAGISSLGV